MAMVRVEGLDDLKRAFRAYDRALANDLDDALEEAAAPVRRDAQSLALGSITRITRPWAAMRIGTYRSVVYVAPVERGVQGRGNQRKRRRKFANLLMDRAMEPALQRNEAQVIRRVDDQLDEFARLWERTR
jgi:hypothetical protein